MDGRGLLGREARCPDLLQLLIRRVRCHAQEIVRVNPHLLQLCPALLGLCIEKVLAHVEIRVDQNGAAAGDTNTLLATIQNQAAAQVRAQTDFN